MNVYLIQQDGEQECWQAETMGAAVEAAFREYYRDLTETSGESDATEEREHWEGEILQSCTLVGELKNPWPPMGAAARPLESRGDPVDPARAFRR